jgi:hypothetical protein
MVLFFDPGPSTGIAVIDGEEVLYTAVVRNVSDDAFTEIASDLAQRYVGSRVGIEAPPQWAGNYRPITQTIEQILKRIFPNAEWINPGQWKGTPASRSVVPSGLTQHEKDAVRAGRWLQARDAQ